MVDDHHRRADQPGKGRDAAGNAAKPRSEHHRQIDDVRTGQKMAQREGLVELLRRHPAVLLDDAAPRPDQHAAEAGQRHLGERDEQLDQAGRVGRDGTGYPAPERRPAANPETWPRFRTARPAQAKPGSACVPRPFGRVAFHGTVFLNLCPYIGGAGSPAMEINGRRNKPFGPGGSTRRLHQSPAASRGGFRRGRNRIDEGVKGVLFLGMVPPLSG